jgi:catechol 2,3-dioxygenase-like lactoylglutathione lyase family enzyme
LPLDGTGAVLGLKYLPVVLQAPYKVLQEFQSIMAMPRGLDHIVHAVRDLDAAADFYRRAGFTVGARNRHSWGTQNHLVQLPGFFMELLTVAEPEKLTGEGFAALFGVFNRQFLTQHEGLSFIMLESDDVPADAAQFRASNIARSDALTFERAGKGPDGSTVTVGFSLAFARDPRAPEVGFAVCRQHSPQFFWNPALQQHTNGATGVAGAVLVAENPTDHHIFLTAFSGVRELHAGSGVLTAPTPRGDIRIMDRAAFQTRFGLEPPDTLSGARLAAVRFTVRERKALHDALTAGGIAFSEHMGQTVVAPAAAMGATIVFEGPDFGG